MTRRPAAGPDGDPRWLFCIGAQKAGTTWLFDYLRAHPEVHVPAGKEMHYFNGLAARAPQHMAQRRRKKLDWYEARLHRRILARLQSGKGTDENGMPREDLDYLRGLVEMHERPDPKHRPYRRMMLAGRQGEPLVADVTPDYDRLDVATYRMMARAFPGSRFLYILRDPVDRAWSNLQMHHRELGQGESLDALLDEVIAGRSRHIVRRSRYTRALRALEKAVPEDRRLYLFYETLFADDSMRRLCDFLGIGFRPGDYGRVVHGGTRQAMRPDLEAALTARLAPVYRRLRRRFGDDLPDGWRRPDRDRAG